MREREEKKRGRRERREGGKREREERKRGRRERREEGGREEGS